MTLQGQPNLPIPMSVPQQEESHIMRPVEQALKTRYWRSGIALTFVTIVTLSVSLGTSVTSWSDHAAHPLANRDIEVNGSATGSRITPRDLMGLPSKCGGVTTALHKGLSLERALTSLDIPTRIDTALIESLGPVANVRCISDDVAGSVVVVIDGSGHREGIVLTNSLSFRGDVSNFIGYETSAIDSAGLFSVSAGLRPSVTQTNGPVDSAGLDELISEEG